MEQCNILRCHKICVQNGQSVYSIFKTLYADWAILDKNLMETWMFDCSIVQRRPTATTNSNLQMKHWDIIKYG
jgi:hypothetical protein